MKNSPFRFRRLILLPMLLLIGIGTCQAKEEFDKRKAWTDPAKAAAEHAAFKVQGEYANDDHAVQVIATGDDTFQAVLFHGGLPGAGWDGETRTDYPKGTTDGDTTSFDATEAGDGFTITGDTLTLGDETLKKVTRVSPTMGAEAPEGAVVLFDGTSADAFVNGKLDGEMLESGTKTKASFGDFKLHLEFRLPYKPYVAPGSQDRGNSGIYTYDRYETQVLDSFGLKPESNHCGGLYKFKATDVQMCLPPLTWQTYDIDFTAPRFDEDGEKTTNARITVKHNGVVIQDDVELPKGTGAGGKKPEVAKGVIQFQGHGNPGRYRNVWIVETASE